MSRTEERARTTRAPVESATRAYSALFGIEVRNLVGETVLSLRGELDISTQQQFAAALERVDENVARIVLDLSALTFIDCSNIGLIHRWRIRAGLRGTYLELRDPNPKLLRVLELTGLSAGASNGNGDRRVVLPSPARAYDHPSRSVVHQSY